ncbi:NYN domain-containing protein [Planomonospora sp. ID82291]|uniref:NYN domain-containing protein n=1 Tax=Planomonospora sp. ID82291 TaxID=2738136 RepID=UPI0018C39369|nr:NYN domain-containing protein [Planomonospora sp. ID82291]MBG0816060.1 NYN domain-containing protein [Planomonospora sp. ID82291]
MITPTTRVDRFQISEPTGGRHHSRHHGRRRSGRTLRCGRAVHLLDIENLTASTRPSTPEVTAVMGLYRTIVPVGPMDQFIVAVNHNALVAVGIALRGVQLLARSGPDGADRALVEAALDGRIDRRFDQVVIGSGDGYFTELAVWLAGRGVHVTAVSLRDALSRRLHAAVPDVVALEPPAACAA